MKHFIPIESTMIDSDAVCALINKYGMRGYGMYIALITELRNHNGYVCSTDTLRMMARKCRVKLAFLQSVITDFGLFDVENIEENQILISSEYVDRVMKSYDDKVRLRKEAGIKGAYTRWKKENDEENGNAIAEEKKTIEKKTAAAEYIYTADDDETTAVDKTTIVAKEPNAADETTLMLFAQHTFDDEIWLETIAMHSGLRQDFIRHLELIKKMFLDHVIAHGKGADIYSATDLQYYFANYIRQGTPTAKRVAKAIEQVNAALKLENPYRYEDVNPLTGERRVQGQIIPASAPPRPNEYVTWVEGLQKWC